MQRRGCALYCHRLYRQLLSGSVNPPDVHLIDTLLDQFIAAVSWILGFRGQGSELNCLFGWSTSPVVSPPTTTPKRVERLGMELE